MKGPSEEGASEGGGNRATAALAVFGFAREVTGPIDYFYCFPASRSGEKNTDTASSQPEPGPWGEFANERLMGGGAPPPPQSSFQPRLSRSKAWFLPGRTALPSQVLNLYPERGLLETGLL